MSKYGTVTVYVSDIKKLELINDICTSMQKKTGSKFSRSRLYDEAMTKYLIDEGLMNSKGQFLKKEKRDQRLASGSVNPPIKSGKKSNGKKKSDTSGSSVRAGGTRRRPGVKSV